MGRLPDTTVREAVQYALRGWRPGPLARHLGIAHSTLDRILGVRTEEGREDAERWHARADMISAETALLGLFTGVRGPELAGLILAALGMAGVPAPQKRVPGGRPYQRQGGRTESLKIPVAHAEPPHRPGYRLNRPGGTRRRSPLARLMANTPEHPRTGKSPGGFYTKCARRMVARLLVAGVDNQHIGELMGCAKLTIDRWRARADMISAEAAIRARMELCAGEIYVFSNLTPGLRTRRDKRVHIELLAARILADVARRGHAQQRA